MIADLEVRLATSIIVPATQPPEIESIQRHSGWVRFLKDGSPTRAVGLDVVSVLRQGETRISGEEFALRTFPLRLERRLCGYGQGIWVFRRLRRHPGLIDLPTQSRLHFPATEVGRPEDPWFFSLLCSETDWKAAWICGSSLVLSVDDFIAVARPLAALPPAD